MNYMLVFLLEKNSFLISNSKLIMKGMDSLSLVSKSFLINKIRREKNHE